MKVRNYFLGISSFKKIILNGHDGIVKITTVLGKIARIRNSIANGFECHENINQRFISRIEGKHSLLARDVLWKFLKNPSYNHRST